MFAELVETLPTTGDWQYEIKLDGYRAISVKHESAVSILSRRQNRMNEKYPSIAKALDRLPPGTVLDGEIVATDAAGRPDFNALQNWKAPDSIYYYAFDIMTCKGRDVRGLPLSKRRRVLENALSGMADPVRLSPVFDFPLKDIIRAVREQGLEGIVAKRRDSRYESGKRSGAWLKFKTRKGHEFVIGGYFPGPYVFDSLLVGYYDEGRLLYIAKVRGGFTPILRRDVAKRFKGLESTECPFANLPESRTPRFGKALTAEAMKKCCWLVPKLVAQIEFADWTEGNHLRHSRFVGLRVTNKLAK